MEWWVAVGDCDDTDNSERSREYRIARVHNRWVYGVTFRRVIKIASIFLTSRMS